MDTKDYVAITLVYSFSKSAMDYYMTCEEVDTTHWAFRLSKYTYDKLGRLITNEHISDDMKKDIKEYIANVVEPELEKINDTSPQILLLLLLNYLVNEKELINIKMLFNFFNLSYMIDNIYKEDEFKDYVKSHTLFVEKLFE